MYGETEGWFTDDTAKRFERPITACDP
ncbi:hypothetical protein ACNKHW_15575 [Shigella flexneri]